MDNTLLEGGFAEPPVQSAQAFRAAMQAMARPGTITQVAGAQPPEPVSQAAGALLLTLCDPETPLFLAGAYDCDAVRAWVRFHTGARITGPEHAMFALGHWAELLPITRFPIGTSDYPDRSTTLIVETETLTTQGATLSGPGIQDTASLSLPELDAFQANRSLFPLGLDFFFTCGDALASLPRSTRVL